MLIIFKHTTRNNCGWDFLKMDTETEEFVTGNSASTGESFIVDLTVKVLTKKELKEIAQSLTIVNGYKDKGRN